MLNLKIIQINLNGYKIILNSNYYFYETILEKISINKNEVHPNILVAINKIYINNKISKNIIISKLKGLPDISIAANLNLDSIVIKKVFQEFIQNKNINTIENKFIFFFERNKIDFTIFTQFIDLSWESYNFILSKLNVEIKKRNLIHDSNEFKKWLDEENISIRNTEHFNIGQWISMVKEENYYFSKNINFLELKINGSTLHEIGTKFNLSREMIRQKISKVLKHLPYLQEMNFLGIYDTYELTLATFVMITNLHKQSFELMLLLSKTNKTNKQKEINIINEKFINEYVKKEILQSSQKIESDGTILDNKRLSICIHILRKNGSNLSILDIEKIFKEEYTEISSKKWEKRLLINALTKSEFVLAMPNFSFKFFDVISTYTSFKNEINEMISNIKGIYSSKYFLEKNKDLMKEMNILNEYELHNFLKKTIENKDIIFSRMPTIFFGYKNRKDFYIDILNHLSPIAYKKFCHFINENYGHKILNLYSNVLDEISEFYSDGILSIELDYIPESQLTGEFLDNFKNKIIFTKEEIKKIYSNYGIDKKYITGINLKNIGFNLYENYVINSSTTITKEIQKKLLNTGIYNDEFSHYSKINGNAYLGASIDNLDVIWLEKNKFVSIECFQEKTKISKFNIIDEIKIIEDELFHKYEIIGLQKIKKILPNLQILNCYLSDFCLNKLISKNKNIKVWYFAGFCLFSNVKKNIDINHIIENVIISRNFIYKEQLLTILKNNICENLSINWLEKRNEYLVNVFYCKELEKYYKNKDTYLREIYSRR